jgi:hypothetical protein
MVHGQPSLLTTTDSECRFAPNTGARVNQPIKQEILLLTFSLRTCFSLLLDHERVYCYITFKDVEIILI